MSRIRYFTALWLSKLTFVILKLAGKNATMFPGRVALKICPDFLSQTKKCPCLICVTGTNGKTTTTNIIADVLTCAGFKVVSNRYGSNINTGVAASLTHSVGVFGKPRVDFCVLEVDERFSRLILPFIKPDFLVVTNLFRDSLKRNAHPEYIFGILDTFVPKSTKLILNADCLQSSRLLKDNKRVFFGIDKLKGDVKECVNLINDFSFCPVCFTKLKYEYLRYHHIGKAYCPSCGFCSYDADCRITSLDLKNKTMTVLRNGKTAQFPVINDALFNIYNELAAITLLYEVGISEKTVNEALLKTEITETRYSETQFKGVSLIRTMAKGQNSVAASRAFDFVGSKKEERSVFIMLDDIYERKDSSEFIGWIYDADFEFLIKPEIKQIILAGPRCLDYKLRLLIAGADEKKLLCDIDEFSAVERMDKSVKAIYLLHDTSTLDLALQVEKRIIRAFGGDFNEN